MNMNHAYRNATVLSIVSACAFYVIFGTIPAVVFGMAHLLGSIRNIKLHESASQNTVGTIPAMKVTQEPQFSPFSDIDDPPVRDSGFSDECSSISTSTPNSRKKAGVKRLLKSLKLRRISSPKL